jgi:hypothetical protein
MRRMGQAMSLLMVLALGSLLFAQSNDATPVAQRGNASAKRDAKARQPIAVTPEREAAVMTFVERNHPELTDLLAHLKTSQLSEYERAVRDIFRTTERLATIQERDSLQYDLEVAAWTAQSRVQLLTAKLKMGTTADLEQELRTALGAQLDARLALLKHERQKAADRLSRLEGDISQLQGDRERVLDRQLQLHKRAAAQGRTVKLGPKNAGKQPKKNAD